MILNHYTTADGLRGIIESKSIWASDSRFLNDPREFRYGLSMFDSIFDDIFASYRPTPLMSEVKDIAESLRFGVLAQPVRINSQRVSDRIVISAPLREEIRVFAERSDKNAKIGADLADTNLLQSSRTAAGAHRQNKLN